MRYVLSFPAPQTHHLQVALELDRPGEAELFLPVWTPGSYLVREYARHLEGLEATDQAGLPVAVDRLDKHRFALHGAAAERVTVRYRIYANDLTVRTSHVDASHAFLAPASVFLGVRGREGQPHEIAVELPPGWQVATALPGGPSRFTASDYDQLIDSPLEIGQHLSARFTVRGVEHELAVWGHGEVELGHFAEDVQRIVEAQAAFWGGLPYPRYLFVLHLTGKGRGGLEHLGSSVLLAPRASFSDPEAYRDLLGLVSHELFHAWNVKRLRPAAFTPYDYDREQYTRLLWWFEGVTCYYEQLLLVRAGILSSAHHLQSLGKLVTSVLRTPGAGKLSVEEASALAWIKLYRPDENSGNSGVSYYLKGELTALALDLLLRRHGASLDEVMRRLWARHREGGVPEGGVEPVVAELTSAVEARTFFDRHVRGTGPLADDLQGELRQVGLALRRRPARNGDDKGGKAAKVEEGAASGWLGAELANGAKLTVTSVREGSPAWQAGLTADDELLAEGGFRLDRAGLQSKLERRGPGGTLRLTLFRRDELVKAVVTLGVPPEDTAWLEPEAAATEPQRAAFQAWCGVRWPGA